MDLPLLLKETTEKTYASWAQAKKLKLTIFLRDFVSAQFATYEMASAIVDWAKGKECSFIVTSQSVPVGVEVAEHELTAV